MAKHFRAENQVYNSISDAVTPETEAFAYILIQNKFGLCIKNFLDILENTDNKQIKKVKHMKDYDQVNESIDQPFEDPNTPIQSRITIREYLQSLAEDKSKYTEPLIYRKNKHADKKNRRFAGWKKETRKDYILATKAVRKQREDKENRLKNENFFKHLVKNRKRLQRNEIHLPLRKYIKIQYIFSFQTSSR